MIALKLLFLGLVLAAALAEDKPKVEILTERNFVREDGYSFDFKTSDGTSRKEDASLITVGDHQGIGVKGSYTFTSPDGQEYQVDFTADDKGYNPTIRLLNPQQ